MKKLISLALVIVLIFASFLMIPVSAKESDENEIVEYEYLADGSYFVTTVRQSEPTRGTVSGNKTASYYNSSNNLIWAVTVYGSFTYSGYSATATSASGAVDYYVTGASLVSREAYTSGASAVAKATVSYLGYERTRTVTLTCDRNGILS